MAARFRNEFEIEDLVTIARRRAPEIRRYVDFLAEWVHIVNTHTDGWAYWQAGNRAGGKLAALIEKTMDGEDVTEGAWSRAIGDVRRAAKGQERYGNTVPLPELREV